MIRLPHVLKRSIFFLLTASLLITLLAQQIQPAAAQEFCTLPFQSVSLPLNDLGPDEYVRFEGGPTGFTGGLYPGGSNARPPAHEAAGLAAAARIGPLDEDGRPAADGKIVLLSLGMSNTFMEFNAFEDVAGNDAAINPQVVLVNGAFPSYTSETWIDPNAPTWTMQLTRLAQRQVTAQQVQVVWVKQTRTGSGAFPDFAQLIQNDLTAIVHNLKTHYPNLQIVYLSSRTRSYTYWNGLSPEPAAFEGGFAVKWLIEQQINGDPALNFDPANGPVVAPYLSWGPYLWADGLIPRSDGLTWTPEDMVRDCTHPSDQGSAKVAQQLLDFFKEDSTAVSWFLHPVNPAPSPTYLPLVVRLQISFVPRPDSPARLDALRAQQGSNVDRAGRG